MIEIPTALVLGAGASTHLRYPIGTELINEVCERILRRKYHHSVKDHHDVTEIEDFFIRLSRSGYYSVDAFLEANDDLLEVGKLLMADALKIHEVPITIFPPGRPGWYQTLFDSLGPSIDDIPHNQLSVITFNYDRSLEFYLHQAITHRHRITEGEALELLSQLNIIHPHGSLGDYPAIPYSTHVDDESLLKICSAIKVVHEIEESDEQFCTPEFRSCHDALLAAERIYFLGFGFHEDNVRRMNFFDKKTIREREVLATCQLGSIDKKRLLRKMERYGFSGGVFTSATVAAAFQEYISLS